MASQQRVLAHNSLDAQPWDDLVQRNVDDSDGVKVDDAVPEQCDNHDCGELNIVSPVHDNFIGDVDILLRNNHVLRRQEHDKLQWDHVWLGQHVHRAASLRLQLDRGINLELPDYIEDSDSELVPRVRRRFVGVVGHNLELLVQQQ
jgi:hypothetical protein